MKKQLEQVKKFQDLTKQTNSNYPTLSVDKETSDLRLRLLREETDELQKAIAEKNLVEVADALGDLQYVLFGTVNTFGLQEKFEDIFNEIHRSNLTKVGPDGKVQNRADGKILKPKNFSPPNLHDIIYQLELPFGAD